MRWLEFGIFTPLMRNHSAAGTRQQEVYQFEKTDGFRHVITEEEFYKLMNPEKMETERALKDAAVYCTELNKSRQEKDNISVVLLKVC